MVVIYFILGLTIYPLMGKANFLGEWFSNVCIAVGMPLPIKAATFSIVCYIYATMFHMIWAALSEPGISRRIGVNYAKVTLYCALTIPIIFSITLWLSIMTTQKSIKLPRSDLSLYISILVHSLLSGTWAWSISSLVDSLRLYREGEKF